MMCLHSPVFSSVVNLSLIHWNEIGDVGSFFLLFRKKEFIFIYNIPS